MRDVQIGRDGSARVRPALRSAFVQDVWFIPDTSPQVTFPTVNPWFDGEIVGSFETFFGTDGGRYILFGVKLWLSDASHTVVAFMISKYDKTLHRFGVPVLASTYFTGMFGLDSFDGDLQVLRYLQIDNKIMVLSDTQSPPRIFHVGENPRYELPQSLTRPDWNTADSPSIVHPAASWVAGAQDTLPTAATPSPTTLISSNAADNIYNVAYFYTFYNTFGESAPSRMKAVKVQRPWTAWSMAGISDPRKSQDQLVVTIPEPAYNAMSLINALGVNVYMTTWSDQDSVPVEAVLIESHEFVYANPGDVNRWIQHTPATQSFNYSSPLPAESTRINYSAPPRVAQGLQVADRVVLVNDQENGARIRWSSNQAGEYLNFSPTKGGGYKTLATGNMQLPVAVKLWQNPQSTDTITILCQGVDGYSTSYYMAPAAVNAQTESVTIMGFEETTATPGTVSPYGVEVFNNALFHPLDDQLMKSTANNYNISHKSMTDDIANRWQQLVDKSNIQSCVHDGRLYYLVRSPVSELDETPHSNELWVYDAGMGAEGGSWSRYLVRGHSLRKIELDGRDRLAVVASEGIYFLDELHHLDHFPEVVPPVGEDDSTVVTQERAIDWYLETNTQGANRAHDAWCNLQQAASVFSNFSGTARYGIRSWDMHGKPVNITKVYRQPDFPDWSNPNMLPFDHEDNLLVQKDLKEWFFTAGAERDAEGRVLPSYGQISLVQYRYTPVSVNVGYEYGSVETFEYGHAANDWMQRSSINGIPANVLDPRRP